MEVICDPEAGLMHKRARTAEERRRLDFEADILRVVAHPGVVQLVGVDGAGTAEALVLRRMSGGDLTDLGDQPAPVVAGLGAAVATTLADLHDLGFCHRAIEAAHVLLDDEGRPVLCSFGRAERTAHLSRGEADLRKRDDVRSLARLLSQMMAPGAPRRALRILRLAAGPGRQHRCHDARWLARQLVSSVATACLPAPTRARPEATSATSAAGAGPGVVGADGSGSAGAGSGPAGRAAGWRWPPRWRLARPAALVAGVCLLGTTGMLFLVVVRPNRPPRAGPAGSLPPPATCPAVDEGCGPVPAPGGILTTTAGRFQLGLAGDVIVLGRWRCGPTAEPAVLRPSTGEVWTFATWPTTATPVAGELATRLGSAWNLRVRPRASGCDRIEVQRRGLPAVTIDGPGA